MARLISSCRSFDSSLICRRAQVCVCVLMSVPVHFWKCLHLCVHTQVPSGCDRRWTRQPDQQPRGGGGHCQARRENQTADHGAAGGHQQTETRSDRTGPGLHGQWGTIPVFIPDKCSSFSFFDFLLKAVLRNLWALSKTCGNCSNIDPASHSRCRLTLF